MLQRSLYCIMTCKCACETTSKLTMHGPLKSNSLIVRTRNRSRQVSGPMRPTAQCMCSRQRPSSQWIMQGRPSDMLCCAVRAVRAVLKSNEGSIIAMSSDVNREGDPLRRSKLWQPSCLLARLRRNYWTCSKEQQSTMSDPAM